MNSIALMRLEGGKYGATENPADDAPSHTWGARTVCLLNTSLHLNAVLAITPYCLSGLLLLAGAVYYVALRLIHTFGYADRDQLQPYGLGGLAFPFLASLCFLCCLTNGSCLVIQRVVIQAMYDRGFLKQNDYRHIMWKSNLYR